MAEIPVVGLGMCTPIGLNCLSTFAAVRSGIVNFSDSDIVGNDGEPVRGSILNELDAVHREVRMAELANVALKEVAKSASLEAMHDIPIFVGLPETEVGSPEFDPKAFQSMLEALVGQHWLNFSSAAFFLQGRSSFFSALHAATSYLVSGKSSLVIVGAVDSQCDKATLKTLSTEERVLSETVIDGIIPGEGACFVALRASQFAGAPATLATVLGSAVNREVHCFMQKKSNQAQGLSDVFRQLRIDPTMAEHRPNAIMTCQTGERFWAEEFSMAYLRNVGLMPEPLVLKHAADSFADAGAASGALQFGIGVQTLARERTECGEPRTPRSLLIYGSSDQGYTGACIIKA